jgi:hypothetical protein
MESGVDFVAADNPHANKLMVHLLAAFAEHEREQISQRTKDALAAANVRGIRRTMACSDRPWLGWCSRLQPRRSQLPAHEGTGETTAKRANSVGTFREGGSVPG